MELSIKDSTEISNLKIVELLKQLAIKQAQKTIVQTKRFGKFVGKSTETQLSEFKEYIEKQAKIYGQNQEKIDDIVKKYKEVLKEIKQKYAEEEKSIIEEKNAYELEETKQQAIRTEEKEKFLEMKENPEYAQTKFGKRRMKITRLINEGKIEEARKVREKLEEYKKTLVQQEKELETKISMIKKSGDISRAVELAEAQNKLEELQPELQFAKCDTNIRNAKKQPQKQ